MRIVVGMLVLHLRVLMVCVLAPLVSVTVFNVLLIANAVPDTATQTWTTHHVVTILSLLNQRIHLHAVQQAEEVGCAIFVVLREFPLTVV